MSNYPQAGYPRALYCPLKHFYSYKTLRAFCRSEGISDKSSSAVEAVELSLSERGGIPFLLSMPPRRVAKIIIGSPRRKRRFVRATPHVPLPLATCLYWVGPAQIRSDPSHVIVVEV